MRGTQLVQFHPSEPRFIPAGAGNTCAKVVSATRVTVYPRWRGEHSSGNPGKWPCYGLSPLARVTLCAQNARMTTGRFIPAGAGNTDVLLKSSRPAPVYPRWRGEHGRIAEKLKASTGLSPLARGTPFSPVGSRTSPRFIPAGAGNTSPSRNTNHKVAVYPRWRGEHADHVAPKSLCGRFIPAGAGNTFRNAKEALGVTVYPRWRGEHSYICAVGSFGTGLSPLARGTHGHR
ncbi:Domain of uncharacterised function (DUF2825) [Klebsiella pneumoniae]|nr:Domain of uncharacterised function (DUF2825) [Klebsiella pneumoniae]SVL67615.1 Domain of uncharacterised function (DUF2825) [Klebsiella pneumoniae]SWD48727.1 Domain of uncharacterised function (DUF2825) [Klebsiella pneumoniae]SYS57682.1 Domain of uncharacterised function (DUF2825) [Klebsiella pneumoniae]